MKKAIGYIRISTKDQSNFSLDSQEQYIRDFCQKNSYECLAVFKDDGKSAKNFDRPDWKALEKFVSLNQGSVNVLIVSKYDRFSRNVSQALQMMEMLENKFNIRVLSVMEPIGLHPQSPFFFQFRTTMLLGAQVEWMVIKDRTKSGIRQANLQGRHVNHAPYGYTRGRDDSNKPILLVDEKKALHVVEIFTLFLRGISIAQIGKIVRKQGYTQTGNSSIIRILNSPVYAGLLQANSYYDEPGKMVKAIHEAVISEDTYWKTQALLNAKKPQRHIQYSDDAPLRGVLQCHCGRHLTAAASKGKNAYHWYYRCHTHNQNLPAKRLHAQFDEVLKELSLPPFHIAYLKEKVMENLQAQRRDADALLHQKNQDLTNTLQKLDNLEEKFINNDIEPSVYTKWHNRFLSERAMLEAELLAMRSPVEDLVKQYNAGLSLMQDLYGLYHQPTLTVPDKQSIVNGVFNRGLSYKENAYRTPYIMDVFAPRAAPLKEKGLLIYEQAEQEMTVFHGSTPSGTPVEHLHSFLSLIAKFKIA